MALKTNVQQSRTNVQDTEMLTQENLKQPYNENAPKNYKVSRDDAKLILLYLAQWRRPEEINNALQQQSGITLERSTLKYIENKHKSEIETIRNHWLSRIADEPATHKRVRIRELWNLYNLTYKNLNELTEEDFPLIEFKTGLTVGIDKKAYHQTHTTLTKTLNMLIEQIRTEVEGKQIHVNMDIYHNMSDADIINNSLDVLQRLQPVKASWRNVNTTHDDVNTTPDDSK